MSNVRPWGSGPLSLTCRLSCPPGVPAACSQGPHEATSEQTSHQGMSPPFFEKQELGGPASEAKPEVGVLLKVIYWGNRSRALWGELSSPKFIC